MDHLDRFAEAAQKRVESGYYDTAPPSRRPSPGPGPEREKRPRFVEAIQGAQAAGRHAVIAELKPRSPSEGSLLRGRDPRAILQGYAEAGATGLSVLTDPDHFGGSLEFLGMAAQTGLPVLMKDFLLDPVQLDACVRWGGSAALLILTLFRRGYACRSLEAMIAAAHERGLEVLLEVSTEDEYREALATRADMIGINHRDLATLELDRGKTERLLSAHPKDRPVWTLSGIETADDIRRLHEAGADAFLVGTSLLRAGDPGDLQGKGRLLSRLGMAPGG